MSETLQLQDYIEAKASEILEFPRIDGDTELDQILKHARRYGRCLFQVAGDPEVRVYPIEGEVTALRSER